MHKKLTEILNEKSNYLDKIEELETDGKAMKEKISEINSFKDKMTGEFSEKIRNRDLLIEKNNEELKHLKSTVRG